MLAVHIVATTEDGLTALIHLCLMSSNFWEISVFLYYLTPRQECPEFYLEKILFREKNNNFVIFYDQGPDQFLFSFLPQLY